MNLKFFSKSVSYEEALGGDIVQVVFEEDANDDDSLSMHSKSVCASINYEFPPCELLFEWMDGSEFDGGLKAQNYTISEKQLSVILEGGTTLEVDYSADVDTFSKIRALLLREIGQPEKA